MRSTKNRRAGTMAWEVWWPPTKLDDNCRRLPRAARRGTHSTPSLLPSGPPERDHLNARDDLADRLDLDLGCADNTHTERGARMPNKPRDSYFRD